MFRSYLQHTQNRMTHNHTMSPSTFTKQLQEINMQCLFLFNTLWNIEQINHGKSTLIYSEQRQNIFNILSKQTHITSVF